MTFPEQDEPFQHGSTVLPGVPLPASAHPHAPVAPPPPSSAPRVDLAPPVDEPRVDLPSPVAEPPTPTTDPAPPSAGPAAGDIEPAALPPRGRHAAPAPPATPARGGSRLLVLAVIGLLVVLVAVAAFVWPGFLTASDDGEAAGSPTASPSVSALAVSLSTPDRIDGMRRFAGAADKALDASVAKASVAGLTDPVSAVYGRGTAPLVQVIAWKAVSPPAEDTVTAAFTGFEGSTGAKVTAVREVAVPDRGGHMECGLATVEKARTLQCFWADDASFGAVTVLSASDRQKATSTAVAVRTAVEQTG
ncbi:hypothetical protein [Longivirga aurantiaca]|uniref:Uncharacterized protein n=1 Tax=Longivirga aurantiaca TaxID=1837743 RepID=A0ABW1T486_9ACTN